MNEGPFVEAASDGLFNHKERLKQKIHLTIMITIIIYKWMTIVIIAF